MTIDPQNLWVVHFYGGPMATDFVFLFSSEASALGAFLNYQEASRGAYERLMNKTEPVTATALEYMHIADDYGQDTLVPVGVYPGVTCVNFIESMERQGEYTKLHQEYSEKFDLSRKPGFGQ